MKTLPIAEVKTHLSAILKEVESGSEIAISSGKRKETIAVIIPFDVYQKTRKRTLGSLKGKVSVEFKKDFKMTDRELISS